MKIVRVTATIIDHPVIEDRVVVSMAGKHQQSRFVVVMVEDRDGRRGFGESATTSLWSGESAETAKFLVDRLFAPALVGIEIEHPSEALELIEPLAWANPFTKAGLDTALWDLFAKQKEVPAWTLFSKREPVSILPTRVSIGAYPLEKTVQLASEFWRSGIRTLKFKVGLPGVDDAARLKAVREILGGAPRFTVDYNGAFLDADAALRHIDTLLPYGVEYVEQPTHRERISLMAAVRKQSPLPVLADESIFSKADLEEAISLEALDMLSLYPGKNGGVTRTLEMAEIARENGIKCAIGSNLETDLGLAASALIAASLDAFPVAEVSSDFASSLFYAGSSITSPLLLQDGALRLPGGVGFGVTPIGVCL